MALFYCGKCKSGINEVPIRGAVQGCMECPHCDSTIDVPFPEDAMIQMFEDLTERIEKLESQIELNSSDIKHLESSD